MTRSTTNLLFYFESTVVKKSIFHYLNHKYSATSSRFRCQEINRMFSDSDSFYYCPGDDLTNSVQRRNAALLRCHESGCHDDVAAWRRADDRFFWNQAMLRELIDSRVGMRRRRQVPGFFYAAKVRAYRGLLHGWHYRILMDAFLARKRMISPWMKSLVLRNSPTAGRFISQKPARVIK